MTLLHAWLPTRSTGPIWTAPAGMAAELPPSLVPNWAHLLGARRASPCVKSYEPRDLGSGW
jgi:hypothetical protein